MLKTDSKIPVYKADIERIYTRPPTLSERLPWCDYSSKTKLFLLEDKKTLAAGFHLTPISCEARPPEMMQAISLSIKESIKNAIPCEKDNPWILQVFAEKERNLSDTYQAVEKTTSKYAHTSFTQSYLKNLKKHLDYVSQPDGIYFDNEVTQQQFRGGILKVRVFLYRRVLEETSQKNLKSTSKEKLRQYALEEIIRVSRKLSDQWRACGLKVRRMKGEEFYDWMVRWFNPKPKQTSGDVNELLRQVPFPEDHKKPLGWDLTENLFFSAPISFKGGWEFDGLPHKVITIQHLTVTPEIGHLSAERKRSTSDKIFNLMDHFPDGSVFTLTFVLQAPSEVELHLKKIHDSAVGHHALAMKVKTEVETAFEAIADGDYIFPLVMALYIRGESLGELHAREAAAEVLLNSNGFKVITDDELYPFDAYLRFLPMCYNFHFDRKNTHRSRYMLLSDIANLLPFYGRSRGTGSAGFVAFNRGGEPWMYNIYLDKTKNAHTLLLGETGTGKSNLLGFLMASLIAQYRPKLFIIDAGGSFDIFGDYCKHHGLSVNRIKINPAKPVSLNPFAHGLKVLNQIEQLDVVSKERFLEKISEHLLQEETENKEITANKKMIAEDSDEDESRDILGEMLIAALLMITGGEEKEEARIRRADRMLVMDAIIDAARFVKENNGTQMIASDIVEAFERMIASRLDPNRDADKIKRAREMADSLRYFTNDPLSSKFFNTVGNPWVEADVTIIDMGKFAQEGYEAQRSVAFAGCVSEVLELAEANQASDRAIYFVADENHLFTKIPLLAAMETRIAKMGRKLGLWLWLATQNLKDFADEARKMLSLLETWLCLALPPDEIDQIERFKTLTPEQRALFLSARKEKGKYTEGVLLSPKLQGLFRNVPPRLYLAMAATEQEEKNQRKVLMEKLGLNELQVVEHIADQMMNTQKKEEEDD